MKSYDSSGRGSSNREILRREPSRNSRPAPPAQDFEDQIMRAVDVIRKKRDGGELSPAEIDAFVEAATHGTWEKYQLSALLMAICIRGMTDPETAYFTQAMTNSGRRIDLSDLPGIKVDKHSTGGVGDKTSLLIAPLVAACGVMVPMMSGRGLGHTGGTLDKLEAIPGFRVGLSIQEFRNTLREVGCAMISQTADVAPADKTLYALRDVTGTVESIPLITASILSKKLAEGISALVMDVKCGRGAFMKTLPKARQLAESLVRVGRANGLKIEAVITDMESPLGVGIGNAIEVQECLGILESGQVKGRLAELSVLLSAKMLKLAGAATSDAEGEAKIRAVLANHSALAKFHQLCAAQGGDLSQLTQTPKKIDVFLAERSGYITDLDAEKIGMAAMVLGAGRERAEDKVDPVAKIECLELGAKVSPGNVICHLATDRPERLADARRLLAEAITIGAEPPPQRPLVLETIT
jgi:pyrimidine-nucleoside phosphorylase